MRVNTDTNEEAARSEILLAMSIKVDVGASHSLEYHVELCLGRVLLELLECRSFRVVDELRRKLLEPANARGERMMYGLTLSTPTEVTSSCLFPEEETVTVHPIAFASCAA